MRPRVFRVAVDVPGWGTQTLLYEAERPEAALDRAARLFGRERVVSVEDVGLLRGLLARPAASVRAEVLTALRDFIVAVGRWQDPLRQSLEAVPPRQREVVLRVLVAATEGAGLGEALRAAGFPEAEAALIERGEATGSVVRMIDVVLRDLRVRERMTSALRTAAIEPAVVVLAIGLLGGLFRFKVFPGIAGIFRELGVPTPDAFTYLPTAMMVLPAAVAVLALGAWTSPGFREWAVGLPGLRRIFWLLDCISVFQALAAAHAAGTAADRAFSEAARACRTERARTACVRTAAFFRGDPDPEGGGTFRNFASAARAAGWEPDMAFVYGVGLDTGRAEEALEGLTDRYVRRLEEAVERLRWALTVGLLAVAGGLVGTVVATFYSTIYELISRFG